MMLLSRCITNLYLSNLHPSGNRTILTLQGVGVNQVDGAGDTDANAHLTHVAQTLGEPRREAHHVVLQEETEAVRIHRARSEREQRS